MNLGYNGLGFYAEQDGQTVYVIIQSENEIVPINE
jgi:hypothetical protein